MSIFNIQSKKYKKVTQKLKNIFVRVLVWGCPTVLLWDKMAKRQEGSKGCQT